MLLRTWELQEHTFTAHENVTWYNHFETYLTVFCKVKHIPIYYPFISLLDIYQREMKIYIHIKRNLNIYSSFTHDRQTTEIQMLNNK